MAQGMVRVVSIALGVILGNHVWLENPTVVLV